ncbi:MAG: hypothetical protein ACRCX8_18895 [Sarcina sp.]
MVKYELSKDKERVPFTDNVNLTEEEMSDAVLEELGDDELKALNEDGLYTSEQMLSVIDSLSEKIEVDLDELQGTTLDVEAFDRGVASVSEFCGKFVGLISVGISKEDAFTLLLNRETCEHNQVMAELQGVQVEAEKEKMSI